MSSIANNGESVFQATNILMETYENLSILFSELDRVGEELGYVTITPRFMRYKSDSDFSGWFIKNFIKLYVKSTTPPTGIDDIRELNWYGVMVDLTGDDTQSIPVLSIVRYKYDQTYWNRLPAVSDHWAFWDPFVNDDFDVQHKENTWRSTSNGLAKKKHYGFEKAVAIDMPLFDVKSPEDIRRKIFEGFDQLDL